MTSNPLLEDRRASAVPRGVSSSTAAYAARAENSKWWEVAKLGFTLCGFLYAVPLSAQAHASSGFDGTWKYNKNKSGPHRDITETVIMSHKGDFESYSAEVVFQGKHSGAHYDVRADGQPYPILDKTGKRVGFVTLTHLGSQISYITMSFDNPTIPKNRIEHWLSQDGRSFTALLKKDDGTVTSIMIFEKQ